ncbi:hypothetical protein [Pseudanabaena sp. 'Roaring Creek']|uniref:hypothetical protein n=1 Tax=Pseudanabaena sp. 'Roaring Creek' TaxID=1681830 RepID=UPI0006D7E791|nr:hypothetical protein [Pseudanabaena sp. 'Roaring Creek']
MTRKKPVNPNHQWLELAKFAEQINVGADHLRDLIALGCLKAGEHWIDIRKPNSTRANYRLNIQNCIAYFSTPAEKR